MRPRRGHRPVPPGRRPRVRAGRPLPAQGRAAVAGDRLRRFGDLPAAWLEHRARQRPGLRARRGLRAHVSGAAARWPGLAHAGARRAAGRLMDGGGPVHWTRRPAAVAGSAHECTRLVLFAGSDAACTHPSRFARLARARDAHARWLVVDPRRTATAAQADLHLAIQPGTDVTLFNGMLHHLVWEGLLDQAFIDSHTEGFDALKRAL